MCDKSLIVGRRTRDKPNNAYILNKQTSPRLEQRRTRRGRDAAATAPTRGRHVDAAMGTVKLMHCWVLFRGMESLVQK
jgi:hypothetical protein